MAATMKMLYGPPGTGKTWLAAREAVKAVAYSEYVEAARRPDSDAALQQLHASLVEEGRILWVTFHPSYSYEDFVEGYRPVVESGKSMTYQVVDGPFKLLCNKARVSLDLEVGEILDGPAGRTGPKVVDKDQGGWVVRVVPNRTDEVAAYLDKYVPRWTIERLLAGGFGPEIFSIAGESLYDLPAFGIPVGDPDLPAPQGNETATKRRGPVLRKLVAARTGIVSSSDLSNSSHFGAVMRRLREIIAAGGRSGPPVALVIDEFNRAEPSRVFGELLTLLDVDKRAGMPEERQVMLPYSRELLSVPQNLSVIATMNTVDKTLAPVDFAMRRRFRFQYVPSDPQLSPDDYSGIDLAKLLTVVNRRLGSLLGSGYEVGHAFFLQGALDRLLIGQGWLPLSDAGLRAVAYVLRSNVIPTLVEYFHNDWQKVSAVIGMTVVKGSDVSLFEKPTVDDAFLERLPEDYELIDGRVSYPADWWNPESSMWDADRFAAFVDAFVAGH